uniref:Uncharacterized protein n=1 Tax=Labrus bergylta TaxID=56723 RepID=A0A3Q3LC08_9LABR
MYLLFLFLLKLTMAGSLSSEARTCSNENDHSISVRSGPASWLMREMSEPSGVLEASSVGDSSSAEDAVALAGFVDSGGLLGSCSLRPTSSILRRRLVTCATARVLENWMNWNSLKLIRPS